MNAASAPYQRRGEDNRYYTSGVSSPTPQHSSALARGVNEDNRSNQYASRYENGNAYGGYGSASNATTSSYPHYNGNGKSDDPSYAASDVVTVPIVSRRRKLVCAATLDDEEVSTYYDAPPEQNPYRNTFCMNQHVLARMEDDLRRAEVRRTNPNSAIPDRGELYEQELEARLECRTPVRSARRSLTTTPRSTKKATGAYHLPPILPQPGPPRTRSRSRSRQSSLSTTPTSQRRGEGGGGGGGGATPNRSGKESSVSLPFHKAPSPVSGGQRRKAGGEVLEDDGTADFIRREKERDIRRRLMKSQEDDQFRRSAKASPSINGSGTRSDGDGATQHSAEYPVQGKPQGEARRKLAYDEVNTTYDSDAADERAVREAEERLWREASHER